MTSRSLWACSCLATLAAIVCPIRAEARGEPRLRIDIEAETLTGAIAELAREANVSIGTEGSLPPLRTRRVRGHLSIAAALDRLLRETGYVAHQVGPTAWRIDSAAAPRPAPTASQPAAAASPAIAAEDIIVSATKRALTLDEAPVAANVVVVPPRRQLDPGGGTSRVADRVEGLSLTGQGAGRNRMFLRGVADSPFGGKTQATVAVLLDDARLTYVAPDPDIRLVDVDRVEILKGPQGSLYGSGALGGIYRIVTNRADPSAFAIGGSANLQSLTDGEIGAGGSVVANIPVIPDVAAVRLVGYAERASGWLTTGDRTDSNGSSVFGVRSGIGIEAGDGWRVDLTGLGQWLNARDSNYTYRPEAHQRPAQLPEPHDNDLVHGSVRVAKNGPTQIVLSVGYTSHAVRDRYGATIGAGSFGLANPQTLDDNADYRLWDSEARLTGSWGRLTWLGGLSYINARQHAKRILNGLGGDSLALETVDRRSEDAALFGEATLPLSGAFDATIGGRLYRSVQYEHRALTGEQGNDERTRIGVTPSAALAWHPRAGRLLYVRYGSAVRQGGTTAQANGTIQKLESDELATLEAGWREQFGRWSFDLGLYHSWWSDVQSDVLLPDGLIETANVGGAAISGAEVSAEARLGRRWRFEAGGMVQSALLVRDQSGLKLDDRRLPVVPSWTLRASLEHDIPLGSWQATVYADARYIGPARLSFDPALDRPMGDYLQTGASIRASRGPLTLALDATNLFDARGDTFAYGNPLRLLLNNQYIRQDPFAVKFSVTLQP